MTAISQTDFLDRAVAEVFTETTGGGRADIFPIAGTELDPAVIRERVRFAVEAIDILSELDDDADHWGQRQARPRRLLS